MKTKDRIYRFFGHDPIAALIFTPFYFPVTFIPFLIWGENSYALLVGAELNLIMLLCQIWFSIDMCKSKLALMDQERRAWEDKLLALRS